MFFGWLGFFPSILVEPAQLVIMHFLYLNEDSMQNILKIAFNQVFFFRLRISKLFLMGTMTFLHITFHTFKGVACLLKIFCFMLETIPFSCPITIEWWEYFYIIQSLNLHIVTCWMKKFSIHFSHCLLCN